MGLQHNFGGNYVSRAKMRGVSRVKCRAVRRKQVLFADNCKRRFIALSSYDTRRLSGRRSRRPSGRTGMGGLAVRIRFTSHDELLVEQACMMNHFLFRKQVLNWEYLLSIPTLQPLSCMRLRFVRLLFASRLWNFSGNRTWVSVTL